MTSILNTLPSRAAVEAQAGGLVVLDSMIHGVKPYIDVVDGHGHIVVALGCTEFTNGRRYTAPLVTLVCPICDDTVAEVGEVGFVITTDTVSWSRVNGNSRYGYEPYHQLCLDLVR